jgi:putative addiction module CopG family antidote
MNVQLSEESRRFIADQVARGRYSSEDAVLEDALVRLRQEVQPPRDDRVAAKDSEATCGAQKPLWEVITEIARRVPDEEWAKIPDDASYQLDHYLYGVPKRPAS